MVLRDLLIPSLVLGAWFALVVLAPFLAMMAYWVLPDFLSNFLFFWPQLAFPKNTFHTPEPYVQVWPGYWYFFWGVVGVGFVLIGRSLRPHLCFAGAGITVIGGTFFCSS